MAVTITAGKQVRRGGVFQSTEDLAQSTATAEQDVSLTTDVTTFAGGTATGFGVDKYLLAGTSTEGFIEGLEKVVVMLATGEAKLRVESLATGQLGGLQTVLSSTGSETLFASATGAFTLSGADHWVWMKVFNAKWHIMQSAGATLATAT